VLVLIAIYTKKRNKELLRYDRSEVPVSLLCSGKRGERERERKRDRGKSGKLRPAGDAGGEAGRSLSRVNRLCRF